MEQLIKYPQEITYWIVYDTIHDEFVGYGITGDNQITTTKRKYLWYTLDEIEWKNKLLEDFGIVYGSSDENTIE